MPSAEVDYTYGLSSTMVGMADPAYSLTMQDA